MSNFEPAFSPATTKEVFLETEDDVFPPLAFILSPASSLVMLLNVPVKTKVLPANSSVRVKAVFSKLKPSDKNSSIRALFSGFLKYS